MAVKTERYITVPVSIQFSSHFSSSYLLTELSNTMPNYHVFRTWKDKNVRQILNRVLVVTVIISLSILGKFYAD